MNIETINKYLESDDHIVIIENKIVESIQFTPYDADDDPTFGEYDVESRCGDVDTYNDLDTLIISVLKVEEVPV